MKKNIKEIIMERDNLTEKEADNLISKAQDQFDIYLQEDDTEGMENICQEYFNLEPDYLMEFML